MSGCDTGCYTSCDTCTCYYTCYEESCTCDNTCYEETCTCNGTCYSEAGCTCDSLCYGDGACICDSMAYGQEYLGLRGLLNIDSVEYPSASVKLSADFIDYGFVWNKNPATGLYWLASEASAVSGFGYDMSSTATTAGTAVRSPFANSSVSFLTSGSSANYENVDEYPTANDEDANYREGGVVNDIFTFTPMSIPNMATNIKVKMYVRGKWSGGFGLFSLYAAIMCSGTVYTSELSVTSSWQTLSYEWTTNPHSSSAWTPDDINGVGANALTGLGYAGGASISKRIWASQCWLEVTYEMGDSIFVDVSQAYLKGQWFPVRPILGIHIYKNGVLAASHYRPLSESTTATNQTIDIVKHMNLTAGDTIKILVTKTVSGDFIYGDSKYTYLCIHRISGMGI